MHTHTNTHTHPEQKSEKEEKNGVGKWNWILFWYSRLAKDGKKNLSAEQFGVDGVIDTQNC